MSTPTTGGQARAERALRSLGRVVMRYMLYAFVAGLALGVLVGWLLA